MGGLKCTASLLLLFAFGAWGCRGSGPTPEPGAASVSKTASPAPQAAEGSPAEVAPSEGSTPAKPSPRIETDMFEIALVSTDAKIGVEGALSVELQARGDWHVNQEYPAEFTIKAPEGLGVSKPTLSKKDAVSFGETEATFKSGIKPSTSGSHSVECEASFALCTDENCVLEKRTLALNVNVE